MIKVEKQVILKDRTGKTTEGKVFFQEWDLPMRRKRALKVLGFFWFLSLASIVLPLAHFVLVPTFFIMGPFVANYYYKQKSMILGGESICPHCGAPFTIVAAANKWPLEDQCGKCQSKVWITEKV